MSRRASEGSHSDAAENRRRRAYTRMYWEKEVPLLREVLRDGTSIAELGSGAGVVTDLLLRRFPGIAVTSVELRKEAVAQARTYLHDRGHGEVPIVQADALRTGLPADAFDLVYARLLFRYLPDPASAIREIVRILKPGGSVVISDMDLGLWGLFHPPVPELKPALDAYGRMLTARHGDARIGRKLGGLLERAGLEHTRTEAVATTSDDLEEGMRKETFLAPIGLGRLERMVKGDWLTEREMKEVRKGWTRFLGSPSPFALKIMMVALGEKTADP